MIVLSLILVIVAAVTLLAGFFSDGLTLIWISIASCVLSIVTLALGVMQRRREAPELAPPGAYVPGSSGPGPRPAPAQLATVSEGSGTATEVIAKTSARDVAERRADVEAAGAAAADEIVAPVKSATRKKATRKKATRKKATAKKATAKKAAAKKAAAKKSAKKATRKSAKKSAKKATGRTTGAAARAQLSTIKGVGPAKQDALLKKFKNLEAIRDASVEDLSSVDGVGPTAAKTIKDALA